MTQRHTHTHDQTNLESEEAWEKLLVLLLRLLLLSKSSIDWLRPEPMLLAGERLKGEQLRGDWLDGVTNPELLLQPPSEWSCDGLGNSMLLWGDWLDEEWPLLSPLLLPIMPKAVELETRCFSGRGGGVSSSLSSVDDLLIILQRKEENC